MAGDESGVTLGQPHLFKQDLSSLVSKCLFLTEPVESKVKICVGLCKDASGRIYLYGRVMKAGSQTAHDANDVGPTAAWFSGQWGSSQHIRQSPTPPNIPPEPRYMPQVTRPRSARKLQTREITISCCR